MTYARHPGVYAIRHIASGRAYIGSATNIYSRWRQHRSDLRRGLHHSPYLQNAWRKYGEAAFVFEVLEVCLPDRVVLAAREQVWMDRIGRKLLNAAKTAEAAVSREMPPEQRAMHSARMKGNKHGAGTHYHGHLTERNVVEIMHRYARGENTKEIAAAYKVSHAEVTRIASRKIWWRVAVLPEVEAACRQRLKTRSLVRGRKISPEAADRIRERAKAGRRRQDIADEFGVSKSLVDAIVYGRAWSAPLFVPVDIPVPTEQSQPQPSPLLKAPKRKHPRKNYVTAPRPERIKVTCGHCGAEMLKPPCQVRKYKVMYCSSECHRAGRSAWMKAAMADSAIRENLAAKNRGKRHSKETRAKMSQSHRKRLAAQRPPTLFD